MKSRFNNLVAKHNFNRGGAHRNRKYDARAVRGDKHKERAMSRENYIPDGNIEAMTTQDLMDLVESFGYSAAAMSNDEIFELAQELVNGKGSDDEIEELYFD